MTFIRRAVVFPPPSGYHCEKEVVDLNKLRLVPLFCLLTLVAAPCSAQEPAVKQADVYPRGAQVTLAAPAKPDMTFDLPLSFEEESLRVTGEGVKILSVETSLIQRTGWIPPALAELEGRVRKSLAEVERLDARGASLQQTAKHLQDPVPSSWKPQDLLNFLDTAAKRREQVEQAAKENSRALEKAKGELSRLEAELAGKMPPEPDKANRIRVKTVGSGTVRLLAWTSQASWKTVYSLDLSGKNGRVAFKQEALVQQKTGIDWDGQVVLHTVQPRRTVTAPELPPLVVDFERPVARNVDMMLMKEAAAPDKAGSAVQEETLTDISLKTAGRAGGDGTPSRFSIDAFSLPSETSVVAIPALGREAWLTAEIKSLDRPLLSGMAELSLDGSPSGKTAVSMIGRGESLKLAFGRVPLVTSVVREAVPREGTTWGRGKLEKSLTLSVTNGTGHGTKVTVLDRIPVSAQEKIKVEILGLEPKPAKQDDRGILTWETSLNAGETKKFVIRYRLTYPADRAVIFR